MTIQVRCAAPEDFAQIEKLCLAKTFYESAFFRGIEPLREFMVSNLRDNLALAGKAAGGQCLVALREGQLVGYAVLMFHTQESITQQLQTLLHDFVAPNFEVLNALMTEARRLTVEVEDEYLVAHLQPQDQKQQIWFYRLGFRPELNRVVKRIAAGHKGPSSERYRARSARKSEHMFIVRVNAEYSGLYRPAGRDTDLQAIQAGFMGCYFNLNMADKGTHYVILEEAESRRPAGYIILIEHQLPMDQGVYTYDVAVAPEFAGRGLSLYLCGAAETLLGQAGGGVIFGATSLDNRGAVNGDRQLGFVIDSRRWGLDCRM
ncbi:GNAT family N-acetyltransferase [bacterium]|nr:GNAT family N-acetyltransferase [bacterium]